MKLQQLNEAKYAGEKGLDYLLKNFFDGHGRDAFSGSTEYYFKQDFRGHDDGQVETVGIEVGKDEGDLYFIESHTYSDDGLQRESATLQEILKMHIYHVRRVNP